DLAKLIEARDGEAAGLRENIARLQGEIQREQVTRTQLVETVDGDLCRKYEMIFSRRGGVAVVEVREGTCQGCRMRVPPQLYNQIKRNDQVFLCPSCQRMLHWQPLQEEASE